MKSAQRTQEESQPGQSLPSPVLTIEETAALFRTTVKIVRTAIQKGELETFKLGRTTYVLREPLEGRLKGRIPLGGFGCVALSKQATSPAVEETSM